MENSEDFLPRGHYCEILGARLRPLLVKIIQNTPYPDGTMRYNSHISSSNSHNAKDQTSGARLLLVIDGLIEN